MFDVIRYTVGGPVAERAAAARAGGAPWLLFVQEGAEPEADFFDAAQLAIACRPDAGGFECRQLPCETQQHIDPVNLATPYMDGAAMLVRREAYTAAGGYDTRLQGRAANLDLSFRLRGAGWGLYHLPGAVVHTPPPPDEDLAAYAAAQLGPLMLSYKYGDFAQVRKADRAYRQTMKTPRHYPGVRRVLMRQYLQHFGAAMGLWNHRAPQAARQAAQGQGGMDAPLRGTALLPKRVRDGPKISVVVRTHNRTDMLRDALQSIANQTYQNYEVVVVEDGAPTSRRMVREAYAHLPLCYHATGQNVGRSRAGNIGFEMATGDFINLLDDDDFFYPDHLELVAAQAAAHPGADLVICNAMAMKIQPTGPAPWPYTVARCEAIHIDRLDLFTMAQACQVHISGVVFKKELFRRYGGFDESMQAHEDWALWLRYLAGGRRIHPRTVDIPRATTVFTQPADPAVAAARMQNYMQYDDAFFNDPNLHFDISLAEMRAYYDGVLEDIQHVRALGQLQPYLEKQKNRDKERD
ncbi:MAG: glycosyltransferase [Ruminococcaceae bacterium]|nr:glycosyltransferase [Oscillospiraceae bacterium]